VIDRSRRAAALLKRLFHVGIALVAFVAACACLNRRLPVPPVENVTPKLRFFGAHKDEFDTLFIGTSRIHHQISPAIFDAATAQAGRATHSFNFGVDGMHPPESFFVTENILALRPRKLRWVFFELEGVQIDWWRAGAGTRRLEYWHDWKHTSLVIRRALDPRRNSPWYAQLFRALLRGRVIAQHLQLFAKRFSRAGAVADLIANWHNDARPGFRGQLGPAKDGYEPPLPPMPPARVASYLNKLRRESSGAHLQYVDPYAEQAYREFASRFAALGARTFFVITPVATQSPQRFHPPAPGPVFLFNDANKFPQLYDPAVRADEGHLTQASADEFTRLLAQQFLDTTR
jgi:hypothetical protein